MDERAEHEALGAALERCHALVEGPGEDLRTHAPATSGWSVAQQLDHLLRAGGGMLKAASVIVEGRPGLAREGGPNPVGRRILASGEFPRGVGKAPASTRPKDAPDPEQLRHSLERVRSRHHELGTRVGSLAQHAGRIDHPYFGPLGADHWLRVARLHSEHHLAIIEDILRDARP